MEKSGTAFRLAISLGLFWSSTAVWAEVQMKSREGQTRLSNRTARAKSRLAARSHLILDFPEAPTPETARRLAERDMRVVAYLPLTGVIVAVNGDADLQGLNVAGFDSLQPEDKLSQELFRTAGGGSRTAPQTARRAFYLVEFHGDVPWDDRRALVAEVGLEIRDHRDLVGDHMLVRGALEQVRALVEWDEVAYVFPASGELVTGLPLVGCLGGATEAGQVGQLTQRVGEGWDGAGLNRANLTYSLQGGTPKDLPEAQVLSEIQRALSAWSSVVQVDFQRTNSSSGAKNINILFGSRDHGDPYPFEGAGRVLAHTFYPAPPNPEPIAGDLHFDNDEAWNLGADIDIFSVALHELGHALGLGHSDVPNAVMYPYYRRTTGLTPEDIGAIRMLYAAASGEAAPTPSALVLLLSTPSNAVNTPNASISVSGTLSGPVGAPAVSWRTNRGSAGAATSTSDGHGGYEWQIPSVPLEIGVNQITVSASDAAGRSTSRVVEVNRQAPAPSPAPPVPTPPTPTPAPAFNVEITVPGANSVAARNSILAHGPVTGGTGRPAVRWSNDRGYSGTALVNATFDGKYSWEANPIGLHVGANAITVTATDTANRSISRTFLVIHEPDSGSGTPPAPPPTPTPTPLPAFNLELSSPGNDTTVTINPISASGTVAGGTGQPSVRWSSDRGYTGTAIVTANPDGKYRWAANPVALQLGANTITVTATDAANRVSTLSFRAGYRVPSEDDADGQPPRVAILTPNTSFLMTSIYSISVRGTATGASAVSEVRWECSCGSQGVARGTTQWTIPNIGLPLGTHTIKVIAKDPFGNEGTAGFTVFRYEN